MWCVCCGGSQSLLDPDFADAAQHLSAQANDCLGEGGLARASAATLVYGTRKFKTAGVHGWSPAAQVSIDTLEGTQLIIRLDVTGVYVANSSGSTRYRSLSDLLAESSQGYLDAYMDMYGVAPRVQRRKPVAAKSMRDASHREKAAMVSEQFSRLSAARLRDSARMREVTVEAVRLRIAPGSSLASLDSGLDLAGMDEATAAAASGRATGGSSPELTRSHQQQPAVAPQKCSFSVAHHLSGLTHKDSHATPVMGADGGSPTRRESRTDSQAPHMRLCAACATDDVAPAGSCASHHGVSPALRRSRVEATALSTALSSEQHGHEAGEPIADSEHTASSSEAAAERQQQQLLPPAAHAFVGAWRHRHSLNYGDFLKEAAGLPWAIRKIGERIHPTPTFRIVDGVLWCESTCLGAKPVHEKLCVGANLPFHEPNLGVDYSVRAWWEGECYVSERRADNINGGRSTVQRRWIDSATGELVIAQDWGGEKTFVAYFTRPK